MSSRGIAILWLALMAVSAGIALTLPTWGERVLHEIHFEHPDPAHRAMALRTRALHRWEAALHSGAGAVDLLNAAEQDLEQAAQLLPSSSDALLSRAIDEARP